MNLTVKIKGLKKVVYFNQVSILMKHDSVGSTFSFAFYFDPQDKDAKILWQPGAYHTADILLDNELILRGTILNTDLNSAPSKRLSGVSGYSLPGVLEDCQMPIQLYPLQVNGKTLKQLTDTIVRQFSLTLKVDSEVTAKANERFAEITANEAQTVKDFLSELARQKNIILSHTPEGELLFTRSKTRLTPIADFSLNVGATSYALSFNGQSMHSQITAMKQADIDGGNTGQETISNPYVLRTFRSATKLQSSGSDVNTLDAVKNALQSELKNIRFIVEVDRWKINGKLLRPNNTILVQNDEIFLYKKTKLFIESVQLIANNEQETAILTCVLPEVYNASTPSNIFQL